MITIFCLLFGGLGFYISYSISKGKKLPRFLEKERVHFEAYPKPMAVISAFVISGGLASAYLGIERDMRALFTPPTEIEGTDELRLELSNPLKGDLINFPLKDLALSYELIVPKNWFYIPHPNGEKDQLLFQEPHKLTLVMLKNNSSPIERVIGELKSTKQKFKLYKAIKHQLSGFKSPVPIFEYIDDSGKLAFKAIVDSDIQLRQIVTAADQEAFETGLKVALSLRKLSEK